MINRIASKIVLSYLIGQVSKGQVYGFFNQRSYPVIFVRKRGQKFDVCKFLTCPQWARKIINLSQNELTGFYLQFANVWKMYYYWSTLDSFISQVNNNRLYVEKSLQKFSRQISNWSYSKLKSNNWFPSSESHLLEWEKSNVQLKELVKILMKELTAAASDIFNWFGKVDFDDNEEKGNLSQFKYKNWDVIMENGVKNREDVIRLLDEVERKSGKYALKVCYGLVQVKRRLDVGTLADYSVHYDTMRIIAKRADNDFVKSFLHELGHRYWFKTMSSGQKREVQSKYYELSRNDKNVVLNVGDVIETNDGYELRVDGASASMYKGVILQKPPRKRRLNVGDVVTFSPFKETSVKKLNGRDYKPEDITFPSGYSKKNVEEFFAECFSFYLVGSLDRKLADWFKTVI